MKKKVSLETGADKRGVGRPKEACPTCKTPLIKIFYRTEQEGLRKEKVSIDLLPGNDPLLGQLVRIGTSGLEEGQIPEGSTLSMPTGKYKKAYKFANFGLLCFTCKWISQIPSEADLNSADNEHADYPNQIVYRAAPDYFGEDGLTVKGKVNRTSTVQEEGEIFNPEEIATLEANYKAMQKREARPALTPRDLDPKEELFP